MQESSAVFSLLRRNSQIPIKNIPGVELCFRILRITEWAEGGCWGWGRQEKERDTRYMEIRDIYSLGVEKIFENSRTQNRTQTYLLWLHNNGIIFFFCNVDGL
jgi:hypothetical protein